MKKLLLMSVITLMLGATSAYAKCEGGVEFQGAINGHTYCRSSTGMTWWAAFAWCEFQGRELATMEQMCPNWGGGATVNDVCPNMKEVGKDIWGWSANPNGSSYAFLVNLFWGGFSYYHYRDNYGCYAVCF